MTDSAQSVARLRWRKRDETPAREYEAGDYEIRWDPAGQTEGEPGGWYLWDGFKLLGIHGTLREAKAAAEADR